MPDDDLCFALPDAPAAASRQKPWTHGDLIAQAEGVGGVGSCGEEFGIVHPSDGGVEVVGVRTELAQKRVAPWNMIQSAACPADLASLAVAGKRLVYRGARAKIEEIHRCPDTGLWPRPKAVEDGGINGTDVLVHWIVGIT